MVSKFSVSFLSLYLIEQEILNSLKEGVSKYTITYMKRYLEFVGVIS